MRNRVTRPRDGKPSRTVSCSSKLNNVSWMGCSDLVWPDLVSFSLVYIEMFVVQDNGNGRIIPFLLSGLDYLSTSIQDGGRGKKEEEKKKKKREKETN